MIDNNDLFERVFSQLKVAESGNRHVDASGKLITSKAGAKGITQIMPRTGANPGYGVKPLQNDSPEEYERFGRDYLAAMLREYKGDYEKALAAYNAGPANVNRAISRARAEGGDWKDYLPKPEETLPYIDKILSGAGLKRDEAPAGLAKNPEEGQFVVDPVTGKKIKPFGPIRKDIDWRTLKNDPSWLDASDLVHRAYYGRPFEGTDEELAEFGLQFMADLNWSLITLGRLPGKLAEFGDLETKMGLLYMMDTFDNVDISTAGVWRGFKAFATDPTNYVGLGVFGIGTVGKVATQTAAKLAFREALKQSLGRSGIITGIESMIFTGTENYLRQNLEIEIGKREEFSTAELAGSAALGGVIGTGVGTAFDMIASKVARVFANRRAAKAGEEAAPKDTQEAPKNALEAPKDSPEQRGALVEFRGTSVEPREAPDGAKTIDDISGLTPEKLKGRRPEDDWMTGPVGLDKEDLKAAGFKLDDIKTGIRATPQNLKEAMELARGLARQLTRLEATEVEAVVEALRRTEMTMEEHRQLALSVQMATDHLKVERAYLISRLMDGNIDKGEAMKLQARLREVEDIIVPVEMMDEAMSSLYGSALRQRQQGLTDLRGISVETIKQQYPDLSDAQARKLYADTVIRVLREKKAREVRNQYNPQIERLVAAGDWEGAVRLIGERERVIDDLFADLPGGASGLERLGSKHNPTLSEKLNEIFITNVFSPTTLALNLVPSTIKVVIQPMLRVITTNPLERATWIEMAGTYSAMASAMRGAIQAAKVAFKYEQALLTRDQARLMEGELANKGRVAGAFRFIPRLLNATDEFLSHVAYNGYVGGKAGAEAYVDAISKGMSKQEATKLAKKAAKEALEKAYKQHDLDVRLKPIVNKGINLGLTGKDLDEWVLKEAKKNLKHIKHGTDKEALDYVRDVLYKRSFSGETWYSKGAQLIERSLYQMPALKWVTGQLFFRTPIRVFEEGLRLTPGVQFFMPHFLDDLIGKNGARRQAKAQGEALLSLALGSAVIMAYAEGKITGAGKYDYRQRRLRQDSDLADPYTIQFDDGSTWTYRTFDPIATPMKIMVTALEYMDNLRIREAQGEFIDASLYKKAWETFESGLMPVLLAISDANLLSGFTTTVKILADLENAEGEHHKLIKYIGERLRWMVPNTAHKLYRMNDTEMRDPVLVSQVIQTQLGPIGALIEQASDIKTTRSYDILGYPRTITDVGALWNIFSTASVEERQKGRPEEALKVLREMDRLARVTGAVFNHGYKHPMTGDLDLRTVMTKDGSKTLYDRWMEIYRELDPVAALLPVVEAPLPDGTFEYKAQKVETMQRIIREYRDIAFKKLMTEEQLLEQEFVKRTIREAQAKGGLWDYGRKENAPQLLNY